MTPYRVILIFGRKKDYDKIRGYTITRKKMSAYVDILKRIFQDHADPDAAQPMKAYMRDQFEYLGIKTPDRRELLRKFFTQHGLPELNELEAILLELWHLPEREYQYTAIGLLGKFEKKLPPEFVDTIEHLLTTKSWWDTVDSLAGGTIGTHFWRFPEVKEEMLQEWRKSNNFWLRRTCILFQLNYKEETDFDLMKDIICENLGSKEFFINKAIGWALRQYSRVNPDGVREFVKVTPLAPLSSREALKWLERQEMKKRTKQTDH
jgi:3-methyladenine DNA glycosylase AlkD